MDLSNKWMNSVEFLAQAGHILLGYVVVFTLAVKFGLWGGVIGSAGMLVYATVKEFWYDKNYEIPKQSDAEDILDFCMLVLGAGLGWLVYWI